MLLNPDIEQLAQLDAEGDAEVDFNLAKDHRRQRRKLRLEVLDFYNDEAQKQKYLRLYTKFYRKHEKKMIGEAKRLLREHGYKIKRDF